MNVIEIFNSIEGEGIRAGELCTFIRLAECNLRCSYCDTQYSFTGGKKMTIGEIVKIVDRYGNYNVTITGGEPLLHDISALLDKLSNYYINIETNGSIDPIPKYKKYNNVMFTVDYKCPSSGQEKFMKNGAALQQLRRHDVIKFVVGSLEDLNRMRQLIQENKFRAQIYVSPVFGKIEPRDIVDYMKTYNLQGVKLQLQIHKFIWPPDMKGV
ncbi:radical SAM protein [Veillonella montpellierensis]|uniref:radical SAM protein n=1 Tax=Veillonella montpellierensis TaxID=187328 RepID=UPI000571C906|nr:radical SAM protein [Veillonella montpellierensis]